MMDDFKSITAHITGNHGHSKGPASKPNHALNRDLIPQTHKPELQALPTLGNLCAPMPESDPKSAKFEGSPVVCGKCSSRSAKPGCLEGALSQPTQERAAETPGRD